MNNKIVIYYKITDFEKLTIELEAIFCPALFASVPNNINETRTTDMRY